jgi:FAD/FMN-containing dehydrogenase
MSNMRALHIDPQRRTARAQAGLTAGQYTTEAARHGLATGFGDTGSVGIAGLTLGGGIGWLVRKHGLTVDDLLAVEIVTADGERLHVDSQRHPDLFWALRGGGGNFGVVTRLHYRLHHLETILGGLLVLPASPAVLGSFIAAADDAPDELSTIAILTRLPPTAVRGIRTSRPAGADGALGLCRRPGDRSTGPRPAAGDRQTPHRRDHADALSRDVRGRGSGP